MSRNARRYKKNPSSKRDDESAGKRSNKRNKPKRGGKEKALAITIPDQGALHVQDAKKVERTEGCSACSNMLRNDNTSEPMVCAALRTLCAEDPKLAKDVSIVGYVHVRPNSQLDASKIDFLVLLSDKFAIPLQVKSSPSGEKGHISKNPYILCFIEAGRDHKLADVSKRLKKFLLTIISAS